MLVSIKHQFAFFSNPKCATTSIERYLTKHCEISINSSKYGKHTRPRNSKKLELFLLKECNMNDILKICTSRDPVETIISWYTYRCRPGLLKRRSQRFLGNTDFRTYCKAKMQIPPLKFFYREKFNKFDVHHVVPVEHIPKLEIFFNEKLKINSKIKVHNKTKSKSHQEIDIYREIAASEIKHASKSFHHGREIHGEILRHFNISQNKHLIEVNKIFGTKPS